MNTELIQNLFDYLLANPETTEDVLIALTVQSSEHTTETATQWFTAFYTGLHEAMILDCPTFKCMIEKVLNTQELSVAKIIEAMEAYLITNPLKYKKQAEKLVLEKELKNLRKEPDEISIINEEKFTEIQRIENELITIKQWLLQ